ncbi:MAG: UDP-N-acetylglucosamine 1-carboxyvinyltransferase [Deltaproteobacteria bacterium]|nr:UDP-N-acetylglucosamine 1-carboxyvinyltransferase [Deltaproteobacteria bacterium]
MDKMVIHGGVSLTGTVEVSGAKNAVLPILAATLLAEGEHTFHNVPRLVDIRTISRLLGRMGVECQAGEPFRVRVGTLKGHEAPYELVKTMRAAVLVLGPLVARAGRARVSLPGGCAIGSRPIDQHLKGLERLGATIRIHRGYVEASSPRLRGARISFDISTVTGTENLMMAAALARGTTVLENAACEPEVEELGEALNKMGARILGAGTPVVTIEGVEGLHGVEHTIMPDRIESGTFMVAAGLTRGDILIRRCRLAHLGAVVTKLREAGLEIAPEGDAVRVRGPERIRSVDIKTLPYPGFPTDMQAQAMVLMALADGTSVISETVFENRFMHVSELRRMGADIRIEGPNAVVKGVPRLEGAPLMASDLRASASLVLAGLAAEGTTEVSRIYHLDRGYEGMEKKLQKLGAQIERVRE